VQDEAIRARRRLRRRVNGRGRTPGVHGSDALG
jgi:hypothetical protein